MSQQAAIELTGAEAQADQLVAPEPYLVAVTGQTAAPSAALAALSLSPSSSVAVTGHASLHRRLLVGADAAALSLALIAVLGRFGVGVAALVALASTPLVVVMFKITGLYNRDEVRLAHSTLDETPMLLQLTGLLALAVAIFRPAVISQGLGGVAIATVWAASFAAVLLGRVVARSVARRIVPVERCLIIGDILQARRIRQRIASSRARTDIVACVSSEEIGALNDPEVIRELVHELGVQRLIIAPTSGGTDDVVELVRLAKAVGVRVSVLPRILEVVGHAVTFDEVEGMPMLGVPHLGLSPSSRALKRAFDLSATSIALLVFGPLILAIAAAIRLDSRGPVFFRQTRVGLGGEHFSILKFRSMVTDAETQKEELRALSVAGPGLFKVKDDPRVTRVGGFLRASSLDELPQLLNVLRGEMTLVGPRPLVTDEDSQVLGLDRTRLRVKPGMTGTWQLLGTRVPLREMIEIDYQYAGNWSLWLDFKILLRTVEHVLRRGNL